MFSPFTDRKTNIAAELACGSVSMCADSDPGESDPGRMQIRSEHRNQNPNKYLSNSLFSIFIVPFSRSNVPQFNFD